MANSASEPTTLSPIKLICCRRKKATKHHIHLTFIESRSINSPDERPSIDIRTKNGETSIFFDDLISAEYFDVIKNNFEALISFYFSSLTVTIYFSDENLTKKETIVKHLKSMFDSSTSEEIFHTFDVKLIPFSPLIGRDHLLLGPVRLFLTMTDLYIAPFDMMSIELRTVMNNPSSMKEKSFFCVPFFTIKHYGNRGRIFLLELGKSKYGDGEIRLKCSTSALASTIHLLASPIIEERPWVLSSAFANQHITDKRRAKLQQIHPPIQFHHDVSKGPIIDLSLPFLEKDETPIESNPPKSRSFVNTFRKFVKHVSPLQRSVTFDAGAPVVSSSTTRQTFVVSPNSSTQQSDESESTIESSYVSMSPTKRENEILEKIDEEFHDEQRRTIDVGVNTIISIAPHVQSVIIVGNSVHLINENPTIDEKEVFPIGQRSFTSPAAVLQPFRNQLTVNNYATNVATPLSSTEKSRQNLFFTLTFDSTTQIESDDGISLSGESSTIYSMEKLISSSSNSNFFRTLSLSKKNLEENLSGSILTSRGSIILFDDRSSTYLFDTPVKQVDPIEIQSKDSVKPTLEMNSADFTSENRCLVNSSTIEPNESENDPNRIPPFIL